MSIKNSQVAIKRQLISNKSQHDSKNSRLILQIISSPLHHRVDVITHNDPLYTQKTHIVVNAPSIEWKKDNLFIYKQSLETFIVPSTSADVHFAKSVLTHALMDYWIDGFDWRWSHGQDFSFGVGFLNCRNQSYRMIQISAFQFPRRHIWRRQSALMYHYLLCCDRLQLLFSVWWWFLG